MRPWLVAVLLGLALPLCFGAAGPRAVPLVALSVGLGLGLLTPPAWPRWGLHWLTVAIDATAAAIAAWLGRIRHRRRAG